MLVYECVHVCACVCFVMGKKRGRGGGGVGGTSTTKIKIIFFKEIWSSKWNSQHSQHCYVTLRLTESPAVYEKKSFRVFSLRFCVIIKFNHHYPEAQGVCVFCVK